MNSLITITNLTVKYKDNLIIDNLSLDFKEPKIISILGKSGVGKSSLFKAILNIIDYNGTININDKSIISYMPQSLALIENLTVYDNIVIPLRIKKEKINNTDIKEILELLQINNIVDKKITELSGGQKSRVALARTLISHSNILLIDEALSSVDEITKYDILQSIKVIAKKYNLLILYITHDIHEACEISDELLILKNKDYVNIKNVEDNNNFKDKIRSLL